MKKIVCLFLLIAILIAQVFSQKKQDVNIVQITTTLGIIKLKLFNETPLHRDNFLNLVKSNFFDSILFHRVIKDFMIQSGDPVSKTAKSGVMLGEGGPGYDIPAEFNPSLIHKKGALAAAREGDQSNPDRKSSGSQFYIVQGKVFKDKELTSLEQKINSKKRGEVITKYLSQPEQFATRAKIDSLRKLNATDELTKFGKEIETRLAPQFALIPVFKFTSKQRKAYTTIGGTPHLDGAYTVFGNVIEGMKIVDAIAAVATDKNDRPTTDVRIISVTVINK